MGEPDTWHVDRGDGAIGEMTDRAVREGISEGSVTRETLVWRPGMATWMAASAVGLFTPPRLPSVDRRSTPPKLSQVIPSGGISSPRVRLGAPDENTAATTGDVPADIQPSPTRPKETRASYVARHWRGELSLGVSYWINGTLVGIVVSVLTGVLAAQDITAAPRMLSFAYAVLALTLIPITIWQIVGIWRSAAPKSEGNSFWGESSRWSGLARASAAIGAISLLVTTVNNRLPNAWANMQIAFEGDSTPHHVLHLLNDGKELEITGGIDFGTAADFRNVLEASANVQTIDLSSIGGRVAEAEQVRALIKARHLATYTNGYCASACTVIFGGGSPRYIGPNGKLGFHRYAFPGLTTQQDDDLNSQGQQELVSDGIDAGFANKVFTTASSSMWDPDHSILLSAGVVSQVVDGMQFSAAADGVAISEAQTDKELTTSPTFAALKRALPGDYARLVSSLTSGISQGKTLGDVMTPAHKLAVEAVAKYRSLAPNDVQVQVAALVAAEALSLSHDHPDVCLSMLNGPASVIYTNFLPQDLQAQDNTVTGAIIDGGSSNPAADVLLQAAAEKEIGALWARVRSEGFDTTSVGSNTATLDEQKASCLAFSQFFLDVSRLPSSEAGALMRFVNKSG